MNIRKNWLSSDSDYYAKEEIVLDVKENFDIRRYYSAEGSTVVIDNTTTQVIIQSHLNPLNEGKYDKKIHMPINTIVNTGSIIEWEGNKWIIVSNIDNLQAYKTASMIKCNNNTLQFYDSTSTLHQIPCIVTKGSISLDEQKIISTLDSEIAVQISNTSITRQIPMNYVFKIGLRNYTVVNIDDITVNGLLLIKMVYSEVSQPIPTYTISILNGNNIQADKNNTLQLQIQVNATVNNITTIVSPTPELIFNSSNDDICTVYSNGLCTFHLESSPSWDLSTIVDEEMILDLDETYELTADGKFLLNDLFGSDAVPGVVVSVKLASDESVVGFVNIDVYDVPMDNFTYTLVGNILPDTEIKSGSTKIYTAHKSNNGVEVVGTEFDFSIIAGSTPSSAYTFVSALSGNSCSIKCNSYTYYVTLRGTDVVNGEIVEKVIKLRSVM